MSALGRLASLDLLEFSEQCYGFLIVFSGACTNHL